MAHSATVAGVEVDLDHFIAGRRMASTKSFLDVSPIDGSVLGEVARGGEIEAEAAIAAAQAAFSEWGGASREERASVLHRIADGIEARLEDLAIVETMDSGALLRSHRKSVIPRAAQNFRFFADWLLRLELEPFETQGHTNRISWDPAGVALLITPWNAPLMIETWKVAPALAAGNTVVLKPSECSPLTASLLCDIAKDAGLPDGALNVVQGIGEEVGAFLAGHADIDRISFTGSAVTGRRISVGAAKNLTPVSLELGGKSPFLVFADSELDAAVEQAVNQFDHAGQMCLAGTRLLVEKSVADAFLERFLEKAKALVQGDPREESTDVGPQITREHFDRIDGYVRRARQNGADLVLGGEPNEELGGLYYRPTLFVNVPEDAELIQKEVFGPVLALQTFADEEEAIALANDTEFGLAATLYTGDEDRAERAARKLVAGTVWVNCFLVRDLRAPFGGARSSGIGREGGTWSFDFFCDLKNTVTSPHHWRRG